MSETNKFGGIFRKLGSMVFTDEYLQSQTVEEVPAKSQPAPSATVSAPQGFVPFSSVNNEMVEKVYALLDSINKPGIDFLELWDAVEAMGGMSPQNVNNAYVALKIASAGALTKERLLATGGEYEEELKRKLEIDVNEKVRQKNTLMYEKNDRKERLSNEVVDLNAQIQKLQALLIEKQNELNQIEATYLPKLQEIEGKIMGGENAVKIVYGEMQKLLTIIKDTIKG
jgi:hypothetical protein